MFRYPVFIGLFILPNFLLQAQQFTVSGTIEDSVDQEPLIGVNIILTEKKDSLNELYASTDLQGKFSFPEVAPAAYELKASYVGYTTLSRIIAVVNKPVRLGKIQLSQDVQMMEELVITGKIDQAAQLGDTTQFNASAFKTERYASGQDLVQKMPGINMQNGKMQAQGEDVQQILVDGKPFFGKDVNAALQNLPAEVIASIQIFDKKSDKAELSGFDDGERAKTINIVTKPNRRKGQFGKASAGYGTDDRYQVGSSVNFFNNDRRLTVTGLSNNVNTSRYAAEGGSSGQNTQNGIIKTNKLGLNFSDDWREDIEISGSYSLSHSENIGNNAKFRDYILPSDSGQVYKENSTSNRRHLNHDVNLRFNYDIDERNRLLIRPSVSLKHNKSSSYLFGRTTTDNGPMNQTENIAGSKNFDYDINNSIYYSHKFKKKGRSFLAYLRTGNHWNEDEGQRLADNIFYQSGDSAQVINQLTRRDRDAFSWRAHTSYTEPVGEKGHIELEYSINNHKNNSDKLTYNTDEASDEAYTRLDTALSNTFNSEYLNQELEIGYQYRTKKLKMQFETEYEEVNAKNSQKFPQAFDIERTFQSWLPSARITYNFAKSKRLELNYRTSTDAPSIGQLQHVIDNSNPLHLRTGNPDLKQTYSNWVRVRYRGHVQETNQSVYASVSSSFINNWITNSTFIADQPTEVNKDIMLEKGSQLTRPVNLDGYMSIRSYVSYSRPVDFIKSNFNINGRFSYTKRPGHVNDQVNFSTSSNFRLGLSLSSNISEKIDFNLSTRGSYNTVENSLRPALNNNYYNQSTSFRYSWTFLNDFVYRAKLNHQFNSGLSSDFDNSYFLLNMSFGKKFLRNEKGEVSINVYDLLDQNNNVSRNVTQLYVEDRQSNVLQRYFMVTFTYNIRHFATGSSKSDFEGHY